MTLPAPKMLTQMCHRCDRLFQAARILHHCPPCTTAAAADQRHAAAHHRAHAGR